MRNVLAQHSAKRVATTMVGTLFGLALSLSIAMPAFADSPPPERPDLIVAASDSPDPVHVGEDLTYDALVVNRGPGAATNVIFSGGPLPVIRADTDVDVVPSQGSCTKDPFRATVECRLGTIASGKFARILVRVTAAQTETGGTVKFVAAAPNELNARNNAATVTTAIVEAEQ